MCGIAGIYNFKNREVKQTDIQNMIEAMRHRGPDAEGFFVKENVGLGNCRLSIQDLSEAGNQPMFNEDASIAIIFNGEIYNFPELQKQLKKNGHKFSSTCDTETIVHLYEELGEKCLDKLNGMFAFAIWDEKKEKLFVARDRLGIKPLYYAVCGEQLIFASEIKSILEIPKTFRGISLDAFNQYFTFQNIFDDKTLFEGIKILPAGHYLTVEDKKPIKISEYWDIELRENRKISEKEWTKKVREVFEQSVKRHLLSDVPIGAYSSGGMDSASIVAVASKFLPHLRTFTTGFDTSKASGIEMFFDERKDAEIVARHFGTEHYQMVMQAGDMARIMKDLVWHLEDLRVGMSHQNYYAASLAAKFGKVVLSGVGGDEMFGGYPWRYGIIENKKNQADFNSAHYNYWSRLIKDGNKSATFSRKVLKELKRVEPAKEKYLSIIAKAKHLDPVSRAFYFELKTFLHGLLVVEDKLSMAHTLEARVPFLDKELVDLALTIPAKYKYNRELGKVVLRKSLSGLLPEEIVNKKKQGFSPPDASWYRGSGMLYIKTLLLDPKARVYKYFNSQFVKKTINDHLSAQADNRLLIWSLLCFEWWNRIFNNRE